MASSLQEQLLKAGLVSEQQAKQARTGKKKSGKQGGKGARGTQDEARRADAAARAAKAEKDREHNRRQREAAEQRAREHEMRQLIHTHRVVREGGDLAYNFADGTALKRLYVNAEQHARLVDGRLAIVRQDAFYELIPADTAERLSARDASLILVWNRTQPGGEGDDPYAGFEVPDDLMW